MEYCELVSGQSKDMIYLICPKMQHLQIDPTCQECLQQCNINICFIFAKRGGQEKHQSRFTCMYFHMLLICHKRHLSSMRVHSSQNAHFVNSWSVWVTVCQLNSCMVIHAWLIESHCNLLVSHMYATSFLGLFVLVFVMQIPTYHTCWCSWRGGVKLFDI
jgi:hypothetical protein